MQKIIFGQAKDILITRDQFITLAVTNKLSGGDLSTYIRYDAIKIENVGGKLRVQFLFGDTLVAYMQPDISLTPGETLTINGLEGLWPIKV